MAAAVGAGAPPSDVVAGAGAGSALFVVVVPALVVGTWALLLFLGAPMAVILGLYGCLVGPWEGEQ